MVVCVLNGPWFPAPDSNRAAEKASRLAERQKRDISEIQSHSKSLKHLNVCEFVVSYECNKFTHAKKLHIFTFIYFLKHVDVFIYFIELQQCWSSCTVDGRQENVPCSLDMWWWEAHLENSFRMHFIFNKSKAGFLGHFKCVCANFTPKVKIYTGR